jgi:hypothetical protein
VIKVISGVSQEILEEYHNKNSPTTGRKSSAGAECIYALFS